MGYDMHVVDEHGNSVHCENAYWHRNLSGGAAQARVFHTLGLGTWASQEAWDAAEDAGFPRMPDSVTYEEELEDYAGPGVADWRAKLHSYLRDRRGSGAGIALYKLTNTNDGWWVTRQECQEFLALWEAKGRPDVDDFGSGPYNDTIPFIRAAAEHDGFRVF